MSGYLVLLSGGLDSTTLAADLCSTGEHVEALSIHYGQRHAVEITAARRVAAHLGIQHDTVDLSVLRGHLTGSALTDNSVAVPEGHYAAETMAATIVPNRNAIMLSVAVGLAATRGLTHVATAVHAGDHHVYPDCRPAFIEAMSAASLAGTEGAGDVTIVAPYVTWSKADIAARSAAVSAPVEMSWSCYQGGTTHCGRCGTCVERSEAFRHAHVTDPTTYVDPAYAREVAP